MIIVAYTYAADIWCPSCIIDQLCKDLNISSFNYDFVDSELALDMIAEEVLSIDRYDEYSFDSDDFPKVVFSTSMDGFEYCSCCHGEL